MSIFVHVAGKLYAPLIYTGIVSVDVDNESMQCARVSVKLSTKGIRQNAMYLCGVHVCVRVTVCRVLMLSTCTVMHYIRLLQSSIMISRRK